MFAASGICYVVSIWQGSRENPQPENTTEYIAAQVKQLTKLKHSISRIIFSHPGQITNPGYRAFLESIPLQFDLIEEPTQRRSYGSWINAYKKYRTNYDYYIFIEDDYVPYIDNFDQILVSHLIEKNAGYLCSWRGPEYHIHAAISNGIASSATLEAIHSKNWGFIPYGYPESYVSNQLGFSEAFTQNGFSIEDYTDCYNSSFWQSGEKEIKYINTKTSHVLVPVQQMWQNEN